MSAAAWGFAGVLVTQIVIVVGLALNRRDTKTINDAVNHRAPGAPTLVSRVASLEAQSAAHWAWEMAALKAIAKNTGTTLPSCDTFKEAS